MELVLKLFGICLIIIICSLMGFMISYTYTTRPKQLHAVQAALRMLETEIAYSLTPLPEALKRVGCRSEGEIGMFFLSAAETLEEDGFCTAEDAWSAGLKRLQEETSFSDADIEILYSIGKNLGNSDKEDQIKHLKLAQEHLKYQYSAAQQEREKNEKMWRSAGILVGLAVVIILY